MINLPIKLVSMTPVLTLVCLGFLSTLKSLSIEISNLSCSFKNFFPWSVILKNPMSFISLIKIPSTIQCVIKVFQKSLVI